MREERKRRIPDAARSLLFAESGVGTIYFYFAGKEEIFAALQEGGVELLHNKIRKILDRVKHPRDRLSPNSCLFSCLGLKFEYLLN